MAERPRGVGARYHRVSTTRQDVERQVADIDRWLAHVGAAATHTYEDHDSRDKAEERHDFQRMMEVVRSSPLGVRDGSETSSLPIRKAPGSVDERVQSVRPVGWQHRPVGVTAQDNDVIPNSP